MVDRGAARRSKLLCRRRGAFYMRPCCLTAENGSFYCFGCNTGGDVISFVERVENLDYIEAVRFLAQRAGLAAVSYTHLR